MIHIVDYRTQRILTTLANKPGVAIYWSDWHEKSLRDYYETFDFIMTTQHPDAEHVAEKNVVIIQDDDGTFREFVIRETDQFSDSKEVYSDGSFIELKKQKILEPVTREDQNLDMIVPYILQGTDWTPGDMPLLGIKTVVFEVYTDALTALRQVAELFGAELNFRVETDGNKITGRYVDFAEKIGNETRKEIVLGKDLIGVKRKETSDIVTALIGIGPERENGTRLTVRVEDDDALERWGRGGRHMWGIFDPTETNPELDPRISIETLEELTRQELEKRIDTLIQYEVDAAIIDFHFGRNHEKVVIGDTIRVKDPSFEPPLYLDARIIAIKRQPSDRSQKTYTLGDFIEYAEEDIVMKRFELISRLLEVKFEIAKSDTPPENPTHNQLWIDTSDPERDIWKRWDTFSQSWIEGPGGPPGPEGPPGYTPIKGVDYFDGLPGQNGKSAFLWVRYSQDPNGANMTTDPTGALYIGIATTDEPIAPEIPSEYNWNYVKGEEGIAGEPGPDGRSSYLHIKYSNDGGATLTGNNGEDVGEWLGTYVDFTETDSLNPTFYTWNKVKGDQGEPGPIGPDGRQVYFHTAYATNATGTEGFDTNDANKKEYIGTYSDYTAADSLDPSDYTWIKVKGDQGTPGFSIDWTTENVEVDDQGRLTKTGGSGDAWDAQAYSKEAYIDGAYLTFKVMSTWSDLAIGLSDTKGGLAPESIKYALKFGSRSSNPTTITDEPLINYTVESGDAYWKIATKLGTTTAKLEELNPTVNPSNIYVGQKLRAPLPVMNYTVKAGETFASIAIKFNTTSDMIQKLNPGASPYNVYEGLVLVVPKPVGNFTVPTNGINDSTFKYDQVMALTSQYETQKPYPYNYGTSASDFDGAGISWGAIQFNAKTGPLLSMWQSLIRDIPDKLEAAFMANPDRTPESNLANYVSWRDMILRGNFEEIRSWSWDRGNPDTGRHSFKEPWNTYFMNIGILDESIAIQKTNAAWYFTIATQWFYDFNLWSRRGMSLMFDIAVQSGSMNPRTGTDAQGKPIYYDLIGEINSWMAEQDTTGMTAQEIETMKLVRIANRRADYIPTTWGPTWRERKVAIANGSGLVYGTLWMDTTVYNMTLEPVSIENVPIDLYHEMEPIDDQVIYEDIAPKVSAIENGVVTELGEYSDGDSFTIHYDNNKIKFYQNGNLIREAAAIADQFLSVDTSFKTIGEAAQIYQIYFAPTGAKGEKGDPGLPGVDGLQGPKGDQGIAGASSYTHIAYANTADGSSGFSVSDSTNKLYIGIYVDQNATDSTNPSAYKWTLIKGADGSQGLPGPPGEDGRTPYFHTAWSTSETGIDGFSLTDSKGRTYIGTYTDFTPEDSTNPNQYTWTKIQGPPGEPGFKINWNRTNVEIDDRQALTKTGGTATAWDGSAISAESYAGGALLKFRIISVWSRMAVGMSIDKTPGDQTKINYGFYFNNGPINDGGIYRSSLSVIVNGVLTDVGTYVDGDRFTVHYDNTKARYYKNGDLVHETYTVEDRTLTAKSLFYTIGTAIQVDELYFVPSAAKGAPGAQGPKGDPGAQGPQGIPGPPGADGQTLYTWLKYADTPTTGMTDTPTGKTYIGLAYNKTSPTESSNYADYSWSLIRGEQGVQGPPGPGGATVYTWIKYADDANGNGMSDAPEGKKYLGLAYNKPVITESTTPGDYSWSLIQPDVKINPNIVLNSNRRVESTAYKIGQWYLSEPWTVGEKYTVTVKVTLAPVGQSLAIYRDSGWIQFGSLASYIAAEGVYRVTATAYATSDPVGNSVLSLWSVPSGTAGKNSVVEWIKVEKGEVGTPWSPNPKDAARIVDSTTEIEANVITSNHINVSNLSAISANLGDVTAGSLKSNTTIDVNTDLKVGNNLKLRSTSGQTVRAIEFRNASDILDARIFKSTSSDAIVIQSNTASPSIVLDGYMVSFGLSSTTQWESFSEELFLTSATEKGYCGVGGQNAATWTGQNVAGTGVNFRIRKKYTPSSITLTPFDDNAWTTAALTTQIKTDGFWLYIQGRSKIDNLSTVGGYYYWRGYYQA